MKRSGHVLVLSFVMACLVAVNWAIWRNPVDISPWEARVMTNSRQAEPAAAVDSFASSDQEEIVHAFSRPLFSATRRPPVSGDMAIAPPEAVPEPAIVDDARTKGNAPPELQLAGIRIVPDGAYVLVRPVSGNVRWISRGDDIGGWTVTEIDEAGFELTDGSSVQRFALYPAKGNPAGD